MPAEALLHALELFDAVNALGLLIAEYETREGFFKLRSTRPVCHATYTRSDYCSVIN